MVSREDFKKVWKDSSKENILNQFYYEHNELFRIKKEVREYIKENCYDYDYETYSSLTTDEVIELLEILDKGE